MFDCVIGLDRVSLLYRDDFLGLHLELQRHMPTYRTMLATATSSRAWPEHSTTVMWL